jgi:hypothetical protein
LPNARPEGSNNDNDECYDCATKPNWTALPPLQLCRSTRRTPLLLHLINPALTTHGTTAMNVVFSIISFLVLHNDDDANNRISCQQHDKLIANCAGTMFYEPPCDVRHRQAGP